MYRRPIFYSFLIIVAVVVTWVSGEVLSTIYYLIKDGKYLYPGDRLVTERNAYVEEVKTQDCTYGASILVHPFLANVQSSRGPCGVPYANSRSFIGKEFPDKAPPRTGVILVTGGSVAAQFTWDNRQRDSHLERILNEQFTGDRFDHFIVLNGGHGAWKQPNQYILFGLYADVLAGVITLDGFNEHYMIEANQRFELPSNNFFDVVRRLDSRSFVLSQAALALEAKLYRFAVEHTLFHVSSLAYLTVDSLRRGLRMYANGAGTRTAHRDDDWVNASYESMFLFHDKMGDGERREWALNQYAKYIRLMHAGAESLGIKSLFLIQPTPAFHKTLTEQEKLFAEKTNKVVYPKMVSYLTNLHQQHGIPVYDIGEVFQDTKEEVYKDAIHVNDLGNRLMAEQVADLIEQAWKWPRYRPQSPVRSKARLS